jgi:ABC-type lipoprotein export system ATPase subunit
VFEVFKNLNEAGQTIVVVTHDIALADRYCDTISMRDGQLENGDSGRSGKSAN